MVIGLKQTLKGQERNRITPRPPFSGNDLRTVFKDQLHKNWPTSFLPFGSSRVGSFTVVESSLVNHWIKKDFYFTLTKNEQKEQFSNKFGKNNWLRTVN